MIMKILGGFLMALADSVPVLAGWLEWHPQRS